MRLDAHQHFWRYDPAEYDWIDESMGAIARDFLPADLAAEMDKFGIAQSIAVQARQSDAETDWLLELARKSDRIAGVVGWIDLQSETLSARLDQLSGNHQLVGFRHVIQGEPDPDFMLGENFIRGVRQTIAAGYAYDVLIFHSQAHNVPLFLEACGEGRFIIDHIAKPDIADGAGQAEWAANMRAIAARRDVMCKLSGMVTEADWRNWSPATFEPYLDTVFDAFGPDRVMFGSDWPVCLVAGDYGAVHGIVADYVTRNCPDKADAIFGENARRAYEV